jgi:hypothetical protein
MFDKQVFQTKISMALTKPLIKISVPCFFQRKNWTEAQTAKQEKSFIERESVGTKTTTRVQWALARWLRSPDFFVKGKHWETSGQSL